MRGQFDAKFVGTLTHFLGEPYPGALGSVLDLRN
jgi:hypothetical protein